MRRFNDYSCSNSFGVYYGCNPGDVGGYAGFWRGSVECRGDGRFF